MRRVSLCSVEFHFNEGSWRCYKEDLPKLHLSNAFCASMLNALKLRVQSADSLDISW